MAKDKKDESKKAKAGRRIPKEIAGFKIPKELRKSGEALLAKAASPEGKAVLATGLTMAAAAAAAAIDRGGKRAGPGDPARPAEPGRDPQAMADAVGQAVDSVVTKLFGRRP